LSPKKGTNGDGKKGGRKGKFKSSSLLAIIISFAELKVGREFRGSGLVQRRDG